MLSKEEIDYMDKNLYTIELSSLDDVFAQAKLAIDLVAKLDKIEKQYDFTRKFIHDNGMEFELLHQYDLMLKSEKHDS